MEHNPILLAASRGARTQAQFHNWSNGGRDWRECPPDTATRLHPDDEHLRFGVISGALREAAETAPEDIDDAFPPGIVKIEVWFSDYSLYKVVDDELHRSLFLLFLSEALAEEGL